MSKQVVTLDFSKSETFTANGKTFTVNKSIPLGWYSLYQALCFRMAYGRDYDSLQGAMVRSLDHLNKTQFVKAAIEINNVIEGITAFPERVPDAFAICCLFISEEGEDRTIIDRSKISEMISRKSNDWQLEGLDAIPFLRFAATLCGDLMKDLREMQGLNSPQENEN